MKRKLSLLIFTFSLFCLSSCFMGWSEFFYRDDQVNKRSRSVVNFDGTEYAPAAINENCFSIIVFSDIHFGTLDEKFLKNFLNWMEKKKSELGSVCPLKFIACLGDVTSEASSSEYREYRNFCDEVFNRTGLRIYTIPGNHDLYSSGWDNWKEYVWPHTGAYRFTTRNGNGSLSWYFLDSANGTLGNPQYENLTMAMKNDPNDKIVFSHYPLYANGWWYYIMQNLNERDALISLYAKNHVKYLFSGHAHFEHDHEFGNYFYERSLAAFKRNGEVVVFRVNLKEKKYDSEKFYMD